MSFVVVIYVKSVKKIDGSFPNKFIFFRPNAKMIGNFVRTNFEGKKIDGRVPRRKRWITYIELTQRNVQQRIV